MTAKALRATGNICTNVYKTTLQRNVAAILAEMPGIGIRAKEKLQTRDPRGSNKPPWRKPPFLRVLESVVTDSGLASPPPSYKCKDRPLAFSCTSTSKTHIIALQERWIHLRLKRNSFHTAFQALQDQSIWHNLVDLSKNWRGMHDEKTNKFASNAGKSLLALSGPITSSW